jgi:YD repeat-containing protein
MKRSLPLRNTYLVLVALALILSLGLSKAVAQSGYSYRRAVVIDHTKVPNTDQSNFPVLISGAYSYLATVANGGRVQNANGYDIILTSDVAGSTKLDHEIESYNAATGAIAFWVRIPALSHTTDTVIYLQYGNSAVTTSQENKTGVWDSNYKGVWHLGNGTSLSLFDSTSNANNASNSGATATAGQIGEAAQFNGSNQSISIGALGTESHTSMLTMSAWAKTNSTSGFLEIFSQKGTGTAFVPNIFTNGPKFVAEAFQTGGGGDDATDAASFNTGQWYYVLGTFDGSNVNLYVNGVKKATAAYTSNANNASANSNGWTLGNYTENGAGFNWWNGSIDEARLSSVVRSADWIAAEYNNQSSPATFYSVGLENTVGISITPVAVSLAAGQTQQFTATVTNATNTAVTWSISPSGVGTINSSGLYTAPATISTLQTVTITVTSVADSTKAASTTTTLYPVPQITSLSPASGAVGSVVIIAGSGFGATQGSSTLTLNGTTVAASAWSNSSITVTLPQSGTTGNVVVTTIAGASNGVTFTVTPPPAIGLLTPASGAIGSVVTIAGSNFGPTQGNGSVSFKGTVGAVTSWSNTSITTAVPTGAITGNVVVTAAGGISSGGVNFTVTGAPTITSLTPSAGAVGSSVAIAGNNFGTSQGNGGVTFNGISASISSWGTTGITAVVPVSATTGNAVVTAAGGVASGGVSFTVTPAPSITSLTPNSGAVGSSVVIAGNNFGTSQGNGGVTFNGVSASISAWGASSITAAVPQGATTGNVVVRAAGGDTSNGVAFTVAPVINSLTPSTGGSGTSVTIGGNNFGSSAGTVTFNGASASISSWSNSSIVAVAPTGVTTGNVIATSSSGLVSNGVTFTLGPLISSLAPASGVPGTSVTITGTNFGSSSGSVTFAGTTASITSWSSTSIVVTVPSNAATGNVVVTASGVASNGFNFSVTSQVFNGTVSYSYDAVGRLISAVAGTGDAAQYTYDAVGNILSIGRFAATQPALFAFSPSSGPAGTQVTISGSNFSSNSAQDTVSFHGTSAAIISASATQLVATVPSGATSGTITVTSPAGSVTSAGAFSVTSSSGRPAINSFNPQIVAAGGSVTISGANFNTAPQNNRLAVNLSAAPIPSSVTSTSMVMTAPSGGSGHISLSTPGGTVTSTGDLFIPPSGTAVSSVAYTGRTTIGSAATVTIGSANGVGLLLFDGLAGHKADIASSSSTIGNCSFQIYQPDGTAMGSSVSCAAANILQSQAFPVSGTYAILVAASSGASGSVVLTLSDATDIVSAITPGGTSVTVTTTAAGQNGRLTFNAILGQQPVITLSNNTIASVVVSLVDHSGNVLTSATSSAASFSLPIVTLPASGIYTVVVAPSSTNTGSITVNVSLQGGVRAVPQRPGGSVLDPSNALSTGLVGLFAMNEASGTTDKNLVDGQTASFAGSTAPIWNTFEPSVAMAGGNSLSSYLNAGTDVNFDQLTTNQMTIVAKVFVDLVTAAGIAEKNDNNQIDSGFSFGWTSGGALRLIVERSGPDLAVASVPGAIVSGQWMQAAFTWDSMVGSASGAHLFLNGIEQAKAVSIDGSGTFGYLNAINQPFRIGNGSIDLMTGSFNGKMAYLAVYRGRILTTTEMAQLDTQLPTNTVDVSGTVTPNGNATTVTTTTAGQNARLVFSATSAQDISVTLASNTMGAVTVSLLSPNGTTLSSTSSSAASFSLHPIMAAISGTYAVYIHTDGTHTGGISVSVGLTSTPSRPQGATLDSGNSLSTNLAGLFVMNEGSGTTDKNLVDSQTASFSGNSAPTWNTSDPAIVFNGGSSLNSYLNAGTGLTFDQLPTSKMTIVAKVYVSSVASAGVAEKNDGDTIDSGFGFGWDSTGALRAYVEKSANDMLATTAGGVIQSGQWMQVAFTWDGTVGNASVAHLFLNGMEQSKSTSYDGTGSIGYAGATNQPFRIGNSLARFPGALNGKIAYLAVYKGRILTATEMLQLDGQLPIH